MKPSDYPYAEQYSKSGACSRSRDAAGSPSDTPETDILQDHCHIDNTPAPEVIDTWVDKCRKMERERNEARKECELWRGRFVDERIRFPWENRRGVSCSEERTELIPPPG